MIVASTARVPDTPLAMGFAVYSILVVQLLTLALDLVQALADPRLRHGLEDL
jgi:ABC-type dipeptide/oligopeptide/nickel transport system permease component